MPDKDINITVQSVDGKPIQIDWIERKGEALELLPHEPFIFRGDITSVSNFIIGRIDAGVPISTKNTVVTVDTNFREISLETPVSSNIKPDMISGSFEIFQELSDLGINSQSKKYSPKDLARKLKFFRRWMKADENRAIVKNLNNLKIRVEKEMEEGNDFQGNKLSIFQQNVEHDISLEFVLNMPIFTNSVKTSFKVEILFDVRERAVDMWLESVELAELMEEQAADIIQVQTNLIVNEGFTVLYK